MKKLRIIATCLVIFNLVLAAVNTIRYWDKIFNTYSFYSAGNFFESGIIQQILWRLWDLICLTLAIQCLAVANEQTKDKAYKALRIMFVIGHLLFLPINIYFIFYGRFSWVNLLWYLPIYGTVALLLIAKPANPLTRINLQQYDLVAYTSMGHRFLHYVVDTVFIIPVALSYIAYLRILPFQHDRLTPFYQLFFVIVPLLYWLLSETIFRQTLGKLLTNSCVVGIDNDCSTMRLIGRTFCRLIPFDKISFLWKGNFHDKASSTAVVYVDTWERAFEETKEA